MVTLLNAVGIVQQQQHVSSAREMELGAVLDSIPWTADPGPDSLDRHIDALQSLNNILKLPGSEHVALPDQWRMQSVQVHPPIQS